MPLPGTASPLSAGRSEPSIPLQVNAGAPTRPFAALAGESSATIQPQLPRPEALREALSCKRRGNSLHRARLFNLAIGEYREGLRLDPGSVSLHYDLAITYKRNHQDDLFFQYLKRTVALDPTDPYARSLLVKEYLNQKDFSAAWRENAALLSQCPIDDTARRNDGFLRFQMLRQVNPAVADAAFNAQSRQTLTQAQAILRRYLEQNNANRDNQFLLEDLDQVAVSFPLDYSAADAQHEIEYNQHRRIVMKPDMVFADPRVLAFFLLHQLTHVSDPTNRPTTDLESYRKSVDFWLKSRTEPGASPVLDRKIEFYVEWATLDPKKVDERKKEFYLVELPLLNERDSDPSAAASRSLSLTNGVITTGLDKYLDERVERFNPKFQRHLETAKTNLMTLVLGGDNAPKPGVSPEEGTCLKNWQRLFVDAMDNFPATTFQVGMGMLGLTEFCLFLEYRLSSLALLNRVTELIKLISPVK